jgi:hypothetical protein
MPSTAARREFLPNPMPIFEISAIAILAAVVWLWLDSLTARETAVSAARAACNDEGLMLLDDTVAITHLTLARDDDGRVKLQRAYDFEYSDTGNNRLQGGVVLLGHRVRVLNVGLRPAPEVRTLH